MSFRCSSRRFLGRLPDRPPIDHVTRPPLARDKAVEIPIVRRSRGRYPGRRPSVSCAASDAMELYATGTFERPRHNGEVNFGAESADTSRSVAPTCTRQISAAEKPMIGPIVSTDEDGIERNYFACGGMEQPDNFTLALDPAAPGETFRAAVREMFESGWEEFFEPQAIALVDPRTGAMHLGGTISRHGRTLEAMRAFHAGAPVPSGTMTALFGRIGEAILAKLDTFEADPEPHRR